MDSWSVLVDITILLAGALVMGALCERVFRSAIAGYLLAGTILGPNALSWIKSGDEVAMLAELGAALLLFAVGLEYSWTRLRSLGKVVFVGGVLQVGLTMAVTMGVAVAFGVGLGTASLLGAMVALSSTASAIKELEDRGLMESSHGGYSVGVLLVQDLAVIPFVILATTLAQGGEDVSVWMQLGKSLGYGLLAVLGLYVLFLHIVPRFLNVVPVHGNRELSVLTAILAGLLSVIVAHQAGLSPALGAFIAGMLLAHSPFAVQVRADLSGLRTLFVTIFFSSIGALADPLWMWNHIHWVLGATAAIVLAKSLVTFVSLKISGARSVSALATGITLAQVGEFAFVIAAIGRGTVLSESQFLLLVSCAILSMLITPGLIPIAPKLSARLLGKQPGGPMEASQPGMHAEPDVIIIGFGPAGKVVGDNLREAKRETMILDLNPQTVRNARLLGYSAMVGDGLHQDILLHAGIRHAESLVITIPSPNGAMQIIRLVRTLAPEVIIVVRSRFHRHSAEIVAAGAHLVIDEETDVGRSLANSVLALLSTISEEHLETSE